MIRTKPNLTQIEAKIKAIQSFVPTDFEPVERPGIKPAFDKLQYQKDYMRDQRTIKRLGLSISVAEYRKGKGKGEVR